MPRCHSNKVTLFWNVYLHFKYHAKHNIFQEIGFRTKNKVQPSHCRSLSVCGDTNKLPAISPPSLSWPQHTQYWGSRMPANSHLQTPQSFPWGLCFRAERSLPASGSEKTSGSVRPVICQCSPFLWLVIFCWIFTNTPPVSQSLQCWGKRLRAGLASFNLFLKNIIKKNWRTRTILYLGRSSAASFPLYKNDEIKFEM